MAVELPDNDERISDLVLRGQDTLVVMTRYNMTEMFSTEDFTVVKNPRKDNMEIISKEGKQINRYTPSSDQSQQGKKGKKGKKVGIAYELDNGEIIYVPE